MGIDLRQLAGWMAIRRTDREPAVQTDRTTAQEQGDDGGAGGSRARVSADEGLVMGGRVFSSFF